MIKNIFSSVSEAILSKANPPEAVPIFPLGSVLFPGGSLSIKVFEQRYLDMAKSCLKHGTVFGISLIREGNEVGIPAIPEPIGTLARITEWDMQTIGILQIKVEGSSRYRLARHDTSKEGLIIGQMHRIPDEGPIDCPELPVCAGFLRKVLAHSPSALSGIAKDADFTDASWVGFRVTELMPFNNTIKQKMLELTDARIRLEILHRFLSDQQLIV